MSDSNFSKKIWVFCFEYAGVAKFGGLGEVSANQSRNVVKDPAINLQVFMPSHGRHRELRDKLKLKPLLKPDGTKLILKGRFDPSYFGNIQDRSLSFAKFQSFTDLGYFEVEVWQGVLDNVPINLLVGINPISSNLLNDYEIYGFSTLNGKMGLFSHVMREYMRYCIYERPELIPDIIHIHDHHPVSALLCCRQELNLVGKDIRSVITMHLLTWPRRELEFFWKCGVNNEPMLVQIGTYRIWRNMREIYDICQSNDEVAPTLEKIGCAVADRVIAVSENFLHSDIIPNCGGDIIRWKSDFTWNGCDWDYDKNLIDTFKKYSDYLQTKSIDEIKSWDFRKVLLEESMGKLPKNEPHIKNFEIKLVISKEFNKYPYRSDCTVEAFKSDGPLILITGRVTPQKGIENILAAIPYVISKIPDVKFLFLMVPTTYALNDLRNYMNTARKYPDNVRFIFGIAGSIYIMAHLSSDVYCCPSRWEPFGIVALEAMASKIPVVATSVGGLMESILHLEDHPNEGTGLLTPNGDIDALKFALVSLLITMEIAEKKSKNPKLTKTDFQNQIKNIYYPVLRAHVENDLLFGEKIRENALNRIKNHFRWEIVSQKLKKIYLSLNY